MASADSKGGFTTEGDTYHSGVRPSGGSTGGPGIPLTGPSMSVEYDTDQEQRLPMMPQSAEAPPPDPEQNKMASENPAPTGFLAWAGFGCTIFALACLSISFASPYWIQTYPNSFNSFQNLGLWEICMDHYMHHKDDSQEIYSECWWVFRREERYWKLRDWLLPPWFISVQVMAVGCLIVEISTVITATLVFLHFCPVLNHEYYQTYAMFACSSMMFLVSLITFISAVMFGVMSQDWEWMPRPDMNFLSWGYGFYIISGIVSIAAGICFFMESKKVYDELVSAEEAVQGKLMEMSMMSEGFYPPGGYPSGGPGSVSYGPGSVSYGPGSVSYPPGSGSSYPPGYDSSYSGQPPYNQQHSYDKSYEAQQQPY